MSHSIALIIGNKNYSSWSLRPWLVLKHGGLAFDETLIRLRESATKKNILTYSPSGHIPALIHDGLTIWDSLAIAEFLADTYPQRNLWPADPSARAIARAVSAEMHSGFKNLRADLTMDIISRLPRPVLSPETEADIRRIVEIWLDCRARFGQDGPFLFGRWSIADAMFAPVATRFRTYSIETGPDTAAYMNAVLSDPAFLEWETACETLPSAS